MIRNNTITMKHFYFCLLLESKIKNILMIKITSLWTWADLPFPSWGPFSIFKQTTGKKVFQCHKQWQNMKNHRALSGHWPYQDTWGSECVAILKRNSSPEGRRERTHRKNGIREEIAGWLFPEICPLDKKALVSQIHREERLWLDLTRKHEEVHSPRLG